MDAIDRKLAAINARLAAERVCPVCEPPPAKSDLSDWETWPSVRLDEFHPLPDPKRAKP